MKSQKQKERIREMLRAESLGDSKSPWEDFKQKLSDEFLSAKIPPLEISSPEKPVLISLRWAIPALAAIVAGIVFTYWHIRPGENQIATHTGSDRVAIRTFKKGDTFKLGKREILFLNGNAAMTQEGEKIRIETTALTADFRLGQKVDMQIRHPLVTVAITGTQFIFDATAKGGTIRLSEGSLAIEYHGTAAKSGSIALKAPAQFTFSEKKYQSAGLKTGRTTADKLLYRYDLVNGETFFAHQVRIDARYHRVEILGGSEQTIPVENILRVVAAENP